MSLRTGATRKGLGAGATRQLAGGISQRTGNQHTTKKFTTTRSGGSSATGGGQQNIYMIKAFGRDELINCEPEDLIPRPGALTEQPDAAKAA